MMLNLNSIILWSEDPKALVEFYKKVLGKPQMDETEGAGWLVGSTFLSVGRHSEVKGKAKEPMRVMFNFETKEVKEEFLRIKELGVTVIKEPYEMAEAPGMLIATFADPDGNYFQLMSPWDGPR